MHVGRRAWVFLWLVLLGCVKTERDYQLEHARSLTPKALQAQPVTSSGLAPALPPQPPRVFTVRAWVDLDYQDQVLHWNERITSQVAKASELTKAALNVELKLVAIETWNRRSARGTLETELELLEKEDSARDVDLALGFVSSLEIFTESQEKLGIGRLGGRHAVLRAMDNAAEHQAITCVFTKLDEGERDKLYRERKLHKEITLVLHEWAHVLGAPHDTAIDSFLNAAYGIQRSRFPPMTAALLARSLELREQKADRKTQAQGLHAFIRAAPEGSFGLQDLRGTLDDLEKVMRGEDAQAAALSNRRDRALYGEVMRLEAKGLYQQALEALRPLLERQPPVPQALSAGCQLSGMVSLSSKETLERCRAAVALAPAEGGALLMLAQAEAAAKELSAARITFIAAREKLHASASMETAAALGSVARTLGFVSWAEQSSGRAMGRVVADQVVEWAARKRRWFGLPAGVSLPTPDAEPAYLERFLQAQNELSANQLGRAEATVAALEKSFPELPGPLTLRCELLLRRGANGKAIVACEKAMAAYPESLQAHYLLGVMHSMAGQHKKAVQHLEQVVAGDVTVDDAWQRLVTGYGALGDRQNRQRALERKPL